LTYLKRERKHCSGFGRTRESNVEINFDDWVKKGRRKLVNK
jgi:hypothetical protein